MINQTPVHKLSALEIFTSIAFGLAITLAVFLGGFAIGMKLLPVESVDNTNVVADNQTIDDTTEPADENTLVIDWIPVTEQGEVESNTALSEAMYKDNYRDEWENLDFPNEPQTILLGTVKEGTHAEYKLVIMMVDFPGMGIDTAHLYLLVPSTSGDPILLDQYSSFIGSAFSSPNTYRPFLEDFPSLKTLVQTNFSLKIPELEESVTPAVDVNGNTYTYKGTWYREDYVDFSPTIIPHQVALMTGETLHEYVYEEGETGSIFFASGSHGFYTTREDGRLAWYDMDVPFWTNPYMDYQKEQPVPPPIVWNDGTINDNLYIKGGMGGCGMTTYANVREPSEIGTLVEAGTYDVGGKTGIIYEVASYDIEYYQIAFESWKMIDETKTWEQFISGHPYFYWQDSLGRWIEFTSIDVLPAAECGKPVIYLYPEKPTDIMVKIDVNLSVSEPLYNDGWQVTAYPDGTLITADGAAYPYLFWEGLGKLYMPPQNYWVVENSEVESFLTNTLGKLGLNEKETADFMEFWYPRMQSAPYYKIGFHGTHAMNQIAPLTFSVHPDMMLRILMDYEPLTQVVPSNPPKLPPIPVRHGFSVIEWGGVLR